jgi:hypothetical protein
MYFHPDCFTQSSDIPLIPAKLSISGCFLGPAYVPAGGVLPPRFQSAGAPFREA